MFNIQLYLEKFKNFGQSERQLKEIILLSIDEVTGIKIENKDIIVKNNEVNLKTSPGIKSVIFVKKEAIINKIKEKGGKIIDLR